MDTEQVRTFLSVCAAGSFVAAAERLHVTQSTVSGRIQALETELGSRLFVRHKTGSALTPAGRRFKPHADQVLRIWEQARQESAIPSGFAAILRVGGEAGLWNRLLNHWIPVMRHRHPQVALRCELGLPDDLTRSLAEGNLDLAVLYAPQMRPGLRVERLMRDDLVLVSTTAAGEAAGEHIHVDWGPEFNEQYRRSFPGAPAPALFVALGTLGFQYLVEHGGRGYFPRRLAAPFLRSGRLHILADAPVFDLTIHVAYPAAADPGLLTPAMASLKATIAALDDGGASGPPARDGPRSS